MIDLSKETRPEMKKRLAKEAFLLKFQGKTLRKVRNMDKWALK